MDDVFVKVLLVISIFGLVLFFINKVLRKWLNVEKKKFFSYSHVNDKHKKIDWTIRICFLVFLFISFSISVKRDPLEYIWFLETPILLFVFLIVIEIVRVIMEKKYAENKNDYIFTAIQIVVLSIFVLSVFMTDFFGVFG